MNFSINLIPYFQNYRFYLSDLKIYLVPRLQVLTAGGLQNRPVCAQHLKRVLTLMPEFKINQTLTVINKIEVL